MNTARFKAIADSYEATPELHKLESVKSYDRSYESNQVSVDKWTPKCQICNKGWCEKRCAKDEKGKRCQDKATICCTGCNVIVCSGWCWKVLHGYGEVDPCQECADEE